MDVDRVYSRVAGTKQAAAVTRGDVWPWCCCKASKPKPALNKPANRVAPCVIIIAFVAGSI